MNFGFKKRKISVFDEIEILKSFTFETFQTKPNVAIFLYWMAYCGGFSWFEICKNVKRLVSPRKFIARRINKNLKYPS